MSNLPTASSRHSSLQRIRTIAHLLDNAIAIPGTSYRVGLDPLLGLVPGAGDVVGALFSAYIVLEAARFGLPRETLLRMVSNLVLDSVMGSVPVLGDFFDVTWKANSRNLALLEEHVGRPSLQQPRSKGDRRFLFFLLGGLVLVVLGVAAIVAFLVSLLLKAIFH